MSDLLDMVPIPVQERAGPATRPARGGGTATFAAAECQGLARSGGGGGGGYDPLAIVP